MSALIKAGQVERGVRAFASLPASSPEASALPSRSTVELALGDAREEISRLQGHLIEARETVERARAEAYRAGVLEGRQAADDDTAQRVECLAATLKAARTDWNRRLTDIDALAVHLSRAVLVKVFAESTDLGDLAARAIALKIATVREESVVAIVVSEGDFPDQAARDLLQARTHSVGIALLADPAMPAGACRLDLKLGHIDLGLTTLASEVDDALAGLVRAGRGA